MKISTFRHTDRTEPYEIPTWRAPVTVRYMMVKLRPGLFSVLFLAKLFSFLPLSCDQALAGKRQVFLET